MCRLFGPAGSPPLLAGPKGRTMTTKEYYQAHREEMCARHREARRQRMQTPAGEASYKAYCEAHREKKNMDSKARRYNRKVDVMSRYGGRCACCGEEQVDALCMDHINGDGSVHRKEIGSGRLYKWLQDNDYPAGFQVLCWNCNAVKSIRGKCTLVHGLPEFKGRKVTNEKTRTARADRRPGRD